MSDADGCDVRDPDEPNARPTDSVWIRASEYFGRWRGGDERAMDDLVRCMTPVLWHVVRSQGLERALAEDVIQTTWMTFVRRRDAIADERAVAGWLTTSARREAWRVSRVNRQSVPTESEHLAPHLPTQKSADEDHELADRDDQLWSAVRDMDERCRRLLRIVAFEDRPDYAQIAEDLAMPIGSIGPTRRRCLDKLRATMVNVGLGGDR